MAYTIHQFSTGIDAEKMDDGQWYSLRFTGRWMNYTSPVPSNIDLAIKYGDFEARSSSSVNPAIIGRIVPGDDNKFWSVVALVTQGRDESRGFPAYRYFWCEGKDNLCLIVGWLLEQNNMPIFNPFDTIIQPIAIHEEDAIPYKEYAKKLDDWINGETQFHWLKQSPPLTVPPNKYELIVIDRLATKIAKHNNRLVSWSYQVETLGQPEKFLIIQPVRDEAFKKMQSIPPASIVVVEPTIEKELKSVIQDLKDSNFNRQVFLNLEYVLSKLNTIQNSKEILEKIFDDLGAIDALEHKMYQSGRMELVTIRAFLISETLVQDYVTYANIETNNNKFSKLIPFTDKNNTIKPESLDYQLKLRNFLKDNPIDSYPEFKRKLSEGIIIAIEEFLFGDLSRETLLWLLTSEKSLWEIFPRKELLRILWNEVSQIYELNKQIKAGGIMPVNQQKAVRDIWADLDNGYYRKRQYQNHYKPLADLLLELGDYQLAYYFYQVSNSKKINNKLIKYLNENNIKNVFGIPVPPVPESNNIEIINVCLYILFFLLVLRLRSHDKIFVIIFSVIAIILGIIYIQDTLIRNKIKQHSLPIIMLVALLISLIGVNTSIVNIGRKTLQPNQQPATESPINTEEKPTTPTNSIDPQKLNAATTAFDKPNKTRAAIRGIIKNLSADANSQFNKQTIIKGMKEILQVQQLDYTELDNNPTQYQKELIQLVAAIYNYQEGKKLAADGVIDLVSNVDTSPNSTMAILQKDIQDKISQPK